MVEETFNLTYGFTELNKEYRESIGEAFEVI